MDNSINEEESITAQLVLDELNSHQTLRGKSEVNISLCRRKSYQRTYLEEICSRFDQVRPLVSHLEVSLPKKPPITKNILEGFKGPQRQFWKEDLFVRYDKNKRFSLLSAPIPIKSLPEVKKVHHSLIAPSIKEFECSGIWKCVTCHCANGSSQIKDFDFDQSYIPVVHSDSFIFEISIADIHRLTARILYISNAFNNTYFPIHEIVCVSPPPYYLNWFKYLTPIFLSINMMVHFVFNV